jgi:hypothetical protein
MAENTAIEQWIAQLNDFRKRSAARLALRGAGAAAVGPLLTVLQNRSAPENVRWVALTLLGECRCDEAVPVLIQIARDELGLRGEAIRALRAITGKDLGDAPDEWAAALSETAGEPAAPAPAGTAALAMVREALGDVATELTWEDSGYVYLRIPLREGRKQQMIVMFDDAVAGGTVPGATVYTECGPATPQAIDIIPRRNMTLSYGRFEVEPDGGGKQKVVMRERIPADRLYKELLRAIVLGMAREADTLEFELTQGDRI